MKERTRFEHEQLVLRVAQAQLRPLLQGTAVRSGEYEREVIEPDTRRIVKDSFSIPFRFICHLEISYKNRQTIGGGTGTLIGRRYVLTAAHNLHTTENLIAGKIVVSPARNGEANSIGGIAAEKYFVHHEWRRVSWGKDYALIKLEKNVALDNFIETDWKPLGCWGDSRNGGGTSLTPLPADKLEGRTAFVAGYPGNGEANNSKISCGSGILSGNVSNQPIHKDDILIHHSVDTSKGESGAPVWVRDNQTNRRNLVGIHVTRGRIKNGKYVSNVAVRITREVLDQIGAWMKL